MIREEYQCKSPVPCPSPVKVVSYLHFGNKGIQGKWETNAKVKVMSLERVIGREISEIVLHGKIRVLGNQFFDPGLIQIVPFQRIEGFHDLALT